MTSPYGITPDRAYHLGRSCIFVELLRDGLWDIRERFIDVKDLPAKLLGCIYDKKLKHSHTNFQKLYDVSTSGRDIEKGDCDITVLCSILWNICTSLPDPRQGWKGDQKPPASDIEIADDIKRIRIGRNMCMGHVKEASMSKDDFEKLVAEIRAIVGRIDMFLNSNKYMAGLDQIVVDCKDLSKMIEYKKFHDMLVEQLAYENKQKLERHEEQIEEVKKKTKQELERHEEQIEDLKKETKENLERHEEQIEEVKKKTKQEIERHEQEIAEVKKQSHKKKQELERHEEQIEEVKKEMKENLERHEEEIEEVKKKTKQELERHEEEIAEVKKQSHKNKQELERHEEQIEKLKKEMKENLERHEEQIEEVKKKTKQELERHEEEKAEVKKQSHKNKQEIERHEEQIEELKKEMKENLERLTEQIEEQKKEKKQKHERHEEQIEEVKKKMKQELERHEEQIEELKKVIESVQHTLKEHRQERDEDMRIVTAVKRRQEQESHEKQKRAEELSAGQGTLKNYLLKLYKDKILQKEPNVWFSMKGVLQMVVPLDIRVDLERWMALSRADRKKETTSKARKGTKINSKKEMFFKGLERQYEIYLLGEAGVGKSTFCHQLIDNWCKVQDTESNDNYLLELKAFPFLFFIQARHAKKSQSVYEMIQTQNCPLKFRSILEEVFTSHPENCLVLIDGLDEWQSGTRGYQKLPNVTDIEGSTILITSRQWRIEALDCDLPSSCRVLEIKGLDLDGIENLAGKALEAFTSEDHQCSDCESLVKLFLDQMYALKLDNLAKIPLILLILIRAWLDGNRKLENARGFIYSGLIESLLIHSDEKVELSKKWGDRTKTTTLPTCFSERSNCLDYNLLLNELARMAFDYLFSAEKENTLVIRKYDLAKQPKVKEHLQMCLKLGLLIESKDFSETNECQRAFGFPHKSIQEFFCAVYLSGEEFETGFAKFCERVTSPGDVYENENVLLFLAGMNNTHCKTLIDYSCGIVFGRKFAHDRLYPDGWSMLDKVHKIEALVEQCTAEARHSVPEGSHTVESLFVIPDMVVDGFTPAHKVEQFCRLGLNIKSLVYECDLSGTTVTPFSVLKSIRTMQHIQRLGIVCTAENTEKYIVCIWRYLSNLHQLKSFSFSVDSYRTVRLPIHVCTELVSKLVTLPNLVSVFLHRLDLSDINTCKFTSQLTSLGLWDTKSLSPGVMSGWCNQLHTLYMLGVYLSPAAVHELRQYLMTSSSLQYLKLINPYDVIVFDDVLDMTSHASLHTLRLYSIDLKSGVRIHPGHHWRKINMVRVSMSECMWQEFIHNLPTKPLQLLDVWLFHVKSLNTQTLSDIRDKFCVTRDNTYNDWRYIDFNTKH